MPQHWRSPGRLSGRAAVEQRRRRVTLNPLCVECQKLGIVRVTDEIDHIIPLAMGGSDNDDNVQGLCLDHHAQKTAAEDSAHQGASNHPAWLPISAIPLTIVCGPPASGKTTHVRERASAGDVVIDLDDIIREIDPRHINWRTKISGDLLDRAIRQRNAVLGSLARMQHGKAWFIVSAPTKAERDWWAGKTGGSVVLLDPGIDECKRRATQRGTPQSIAGIDTWHKAARQPWSAPKPRATRPTIGADGWPISI